MQKNKKSTQDADSIAIDGLLFIAGDDELLPRFLALTGIQAEQIREAAKERGFLAGVLQFLLAHEPSLFKFCEHSGHAPESVDIAASSLLGSEERNLYST